MNKRFFFTTLVLLVAYVLSACGALQPAGDVSGDQAAIKVRAMEVAFTGVVEAMNGNEWTVNGQVLTIDPALVHDGPFQVGDTIKVEGTVNQDGSINVASVEAPSATDLTGLPQLGNDNSNTNSNSNDNLNANSNDANSNDVNLNGNSNDNNSNDDSINANSNDDDSDDDHNGNSNSSMDDDHDDDNGNGNSNSNTNDDSGDDHSGGGGGGNSNDNGSDD